jgi:hypothetical protein
LFPFCTRCDAILGDITRLICPFNWEKIKGYWIVLVPQKQMILLVAIVVQTFSIIDNKVAFLIGIEI